MPRQYPEDENNQDLKMFCERIDNYPSVNVTFNAEVTPVLLTRVYAACAALWWNSNS